MKDISMPQGTATGKKFSPESLRAFLGGATLCPGSHLASTETLAVVVMFVMRFVITPTLEGRKWEYIDYQGCDRKA